LQAKLEAEHVVNVVAHLNGASGRIARVIPLIALRPIAVDRAAIPGFIVEQRDQFTGLEIQPGANRNVQFHVSFAQPGETRNMSAAGIDNRSILAPNEGDSIGRIPFVLVHVGTGQRQFDFVDGERVQEVFQR
jgi:hypothetical protein